MNLLRQVWLDKKHERSHRAGALEKALPEDRFGFNKKHERSQRAGSIEKALDLEKLAIIFPKAL